MTHPAAILLAAGTSSRLGTPKQKLPYRGKTFLRHLIDELGLVASPVVVALPPGEDEIGLDLSPRPRKLVDDLKRRPRRSVVGLRSPSMEEGMGSSLAFVARSLPGTPRWLQWFRSRASLDRSHGVLVALVDQPLADRELFAALERAAREGSGWAACDYGEGDWGVPARFPVSALAELAALSGDRGARSLLEARRASGELALVPFPGGRLDVDTEADYARLLELAGEGDGGDGGAPPG